MTLVEAKGIIFISSLILMMSCSSGFLPGVSLFIRASSGNVVVAIHLYIYRHGKKISLGTISGITKNI